MALVKSVMLVDGENLVLRYQEMLNDKNIIKKESNIYIKDSFVWNKQITELFQVDVFRIKYFTSQTGSDEDIETLKKKISQIQYDQSANYYKGC